MLRGLPIVLVALLSPESARAQAPSQTPSVAEALFEDAQRLLEAGNVHEACAKFAESQRDDPGLGTLLRLALCHEREGKTATAWAEFEEAQAQAHRRREFDREALAHTHASALVQSVDRIVLGMAEPPADLTIAVDGTALGAGTLGTPLPLDPGRHVIEASAPGKQSRAVTVSLGASGNTERIDIPNLEDIRVAPLASEPRASTGVPRRSIGYVVGAAGIVILGVAAVFDVMALSKDSQSNNREQEHTAADADSIWRDAQHDQTVAQIALGVGVAALGSGVILAFWPPASRAAPRTATQSRAQMAMQAVTVTAALGPASGSLVFRARW
jgi:hypothetical protein